MGGQAMRAKKEHFGQGDNKCITDENYSLKVAKDRCYVRLWEGSNFDGYEDLLVQDTDDDCHSTNIFGQRGYYYMGCNDANSMKVFSTSDWQQYQVYAKGQVQDDYMRQNPTLNHVRVMT